MTSDEALMLEFQGGSRAAFEELFARYRKPLYCLFGRRLNNPTRAEDVELVAKTKDPVRSDTGITIQPSKTFADCADPLDILFAGGGGDGTVALMTDSETLDFLARRGKTAKLVTSVCTGSMVLGAAGLLRGYKATSHWSVRDLLPQLGAELVINRVVQDRSGLLKSLSLVRLRMRKVAMAQHTSPERH